MPPTARALKYPIDSPQHRQYILSLYRKILRAIYTHFRPEKDDALQEASEYFHANMHERNEDKVALHVEEAEARYEMALHYKIWQPRPFLIPRQGGEVATDVTITNPYVIPKYMATEYRDHLDEAEKVIEREREEGKGHFVDFDDDDDRKW